MEIALSRRHVRGDGWRETEQTLLHEMIHQWQAEAGQPVDRGAEFKRKARELGIPRAKPSAHRGRRCAPVRRASISTTSTASCPRRSARSATRSVPGWTTRSCPVIGEAYIAGRFPKELIPGMAELGLFGANLPEEYGCAGLGPVAYGLIMQELERGDSASAASPRCRARWSCTRSTPSAPRRRRERWLPRMARGEAIGCFGLTEPDFGSNPSGMRTTASETRDGWVLNGEKRWITTGRIADVAVVWAKTGHRATRRCAASWSPSDAGLHTREIEGKFSLRASVTSELIFEDCAVPADAMLPGSGGLRVPLTCLNQARFGISWGAIGAAMACYDEALRYTKQRMQFKPPHRPDQIQQVRAGRHAEEITKAQLLACGWAGSRKRARCRRSRSRWPSATTCACACESPAKRALLGANGVTDEYQSGRHMCNLESVFTYEGTDHIHTLILGRGGHGAVGLLAQAFRCTILWQTLSGCWPIPDASDIVRGMRDRRGMP